jgi:poly-gamma-glutamate synthesis protein (capsule biosynthesis protein)
MSKKTTEWKKQTIHFAISAFLLLFSVVIFQKVYLDTIDPTYNLAQVSNQDVISVNTVRLLFVGDMMFDRAIRKTVNRFGYNYVFGDSKQIFNNYDLVIGNLEGSITDFASKTLRPDGTTSGTPLDFTFATATAPALKQNGIDVVSLANNHSFNRGQIGLDETRKYLAGSGVDFFGDPNNIAGQISTTKCVNNICIGIVGYNEFSYINEDKVLDEVKNLRPKVDVLIVMPHWGVEYQKKPSSLQKRLAHEWIDAGADVVVGSHPHIIESVENYRGKKIFYSMGNYIFDQTFSFDTTHGLTVGINIMKSNHNEQTGNQNNVDISYDLKPIENSKLSVKIPDATTTEKILNGITDISN